jgi:NAD(P)-dependent dehydrogenase (short-subunit alcohol dehydrogenase family)
VPGVAVVTGAGRGFGRAIAERLAARGYTVQLVREHDDEPEAAIIWSGRRLLTVDEVADEAVGLLDSKKLVHMVPRWRGWGARANAMAGRAGLRTAPLLRRAGERRRARAG